ncbi:putative B3/B4 tRNA-binding domain, phenylalanyl-tRNA synthetase-like, B3/B4 [Septoria linicola]|nr:putative B3/B4 tRNA-binding domain, phenylalanyl-tRNA synthetase-like, B3/B4 [Septoria linicola]
MSTTSTSPTLTAYLSKAHISPEVFTLRPDYRALLIAVSGLSAGGPSDNFSESHLQEAETSARKHLAPGQSVNDIPHVAAWREAYKAFGAKPNKHRNSLEALTRRITADGNSGLPRINCLTDIYNAICVKWQIPLGGEDLGKYAGAPFLKRADGSEKFEVSEKGERKVENADKGEVVWCDDEGVTCRRWNWRQGPRTALDEKTEKVLFICDALEPMSDEDLERVGDELVDALRKISPELEVARRTIRME